MTYTEIENLRNFTDILEDGEEVIVTEKLHGTNCRVGSIEGEWMAGSKGLRRKRPENTQGMAANTYWFPLTLPPVQSLIETMGAEYRQFILFGEVYGSRIQDLGYGCKGMLGFRAFDAFADGRDLDADTFLELCARFGVETVPNLYRGAYSLERVRDLSAGNTTMGDDHIREGVVVKPVVERTHPKVGRVILKYIGDQYLFSKSADRDTNDV